MGYAGYKNNVRTLIDGFPPSRAVLSPMTKGDRVLSPRQRLSLKNRSRGLLTILMIGNIARTRTNLRYNVLCNLVISNGNRIFTSKKNRLLQALSRYLGKDNPETVKADNCLVWNEGDQFTAAAFNYLNVMLNLTKPVVSEIELRNKFAKLSIGTEKGFDINSFDKETQKAIAEGVKEGFGDIEKFIDKESTDPLSSSKIFGSRDFLAKSAKENYAMDDFYIPRAVAAHLGLCGSLLLIK